MNIAIVKEDAIEEADRAPGKPSPWWPTITVRASLNRSDGTVLWTESDHAYQASGGDLRASESWQAVNLLRKLNFICEELVGEIFDSNR